MLTRHISPENVAVQGQHAFEIGVKAVRAHPGVRSSFVSLLPADAAPSDIDALIERLLTKFFHAAGNNFCQAFNSTVGSTGGKDGVAVRTELKVLQKAAAKTVEAKQVVKFVPSQAFALPPPVLHTLLTLVVELDADSLKKAQMPALQSLLRAYAAEGATAQTGGKKADLITRVQDAVRAAGSRGFIRPPVFDPNSMTVDAHATATAVVPATVAPAAAAPHTS